MATEADRQGGGTTSLRTGAHNYRDDVREFFRRCSFCGSTECDCIRNAAIEGGQSTYPESIAEVGNLFVYFILGILSGLPIAVLIIGLVRWWL